MHKITLIPGDGIGPELMEVTVRATEATGVRIKWETMQAGSSAVKKEGKPLPDKVIESIKRNKVALKGPITTPIGSGFRSVNVALRRELDLYACVRPCKTFPGIDSRHGDVDLVIVRENTEDLYSGVEYDLGEEDTMELIRFIKRTKDRQLPDSAISIKSISPKASERIARFAFEYARKNRRKKVTASTKSNIMKSTDGLFQRAAEEASKGYDIPYEHRLIDSLCMQLVIDPSRYDVLLLPNLYGDIVSDLAAGLVGGLGMAPGYNIGDEYAVFEATHGSAPEFKGTGRLNPSALILSSALMLRHINEPRAADLMEGSLAEVISERKSLTFDLNPEKPATTNEMGEAIMEKIRENA